MLSDRYYMRETPSGFRFDLVKTLMAVFTALFLLQHVVEKWFGVYGHYAWFGLSGDAVLHGHRIWTLLTYNFLQSTIDPSVLRNSGSYTGGVIVLISNLLVLYFCGGDVCEKLGPRRFALLYGGLILAGGLAWCAASVLGVSWLLLTPMASLTGLFVLFCCYHADERMQFLVFFVLPVTMKPKYFCWGWMAVELFGFAFYEMGGRPSPLWNGHAADLAAALAAYGYYRLAGRVDLFGGVGSPRIELPRWLRRRKKTAAPTAFKVNLTSREDLRAEVDRILDKINSEGFGALTEEEKRLLDDARDVLSHR